MDADSIEAVEHHVRLRRLSSARSRKIPITRPFRKWPSIQIKRAKRRKLLPMW
jgi:hypothetical protein